MKTLFITISILVFCAGSFHCALDPINALIPTTIDQQYGTENILESYDPAIENKIVAANNKLGIDIFKELTLSNPDQNIFISPLSIFYTLGMLFNGAAGSTESMFIKYFDLGTGDRSAINANYKLLLDNLVNQESSLVFTIANSIWYADGFPVLEKFKSDNTFYFNAEIASLNFSNPASADVINNWVKNNTNDKIDKIISPVELNQIVFAIINAVYFNASWTYPFDPEKTKQAIFNPSDGDQTEILMMKQHSGQYFKYYESQNFQSISLPYGDKIFEMIILLPKQGFRTDELITGLTEDDWNKILSTRNTRKILLSMPKFNFEFSINIEDIMKNIGLGAIFNGNYSNMTPEPISISKVKHKTFVDVNEIGTEAAAVTALVARSNPRNIVVDRPFVFVISENINNTILFMGKVEKPEYKN